MKSEIRKKQKVLIADDSEMNRSILTDMLGEDFEIIEAVDGKQAVTMLQKHNLEFSILLLDIVMPEMDGFEVLAMMNQYHWIEDVPVIMISAETSPSYIERAYELGVTDFVSRPFDELIVRRRVLNTIMLYAKQKKLVGLVSDQIYEKEKNSDLMVNILSHIVEFRNGESGLHVLHIQTITEMLLKKLVQITGQYRLSASDISLIGKASALHDIGKIAIPDEILNKPGRFTPEEYEQMKTHAAIGASMLEELPFYGDEPLVKIAYQICRWHHERYDGKGYPDGLKGEEIPIAAQIVSLADVYDALTSKRVYKDAYSHEKAIQMIVNGECGVFNPVLLECLQAIGESIRSELQVNSPNQHSQREIQNVTAEILRHEELGVSERTLRLLEHERTKFQFFASLSQEIQFEYTTQPPMLSVYDWGAHQLGLNEIIMNPEEDEKLIEVIGKDNLHQLTEKLHKTTPENPVAQIDCEIQINGSPRWSRIISRTMWFDEENPQCTGAIGKVVDIHEERLQMAALRHRASHDLLTGLMNHTYAREYIQQRIKSRPDGNFALVIFDLDHFKQANDNYGHSFGDQVLQYVADKLSRSIRGEDVAARVGGDEFLIFLEYKTDLEAAIQRIFRTLTGEFNGFPISLSMGIATTEDGENEYDALFHRADQALYAVKRGGRGHYRYYDDSIKDTLSVISSID